MVAVKENHAVNWSKVGAKSCRKGKRFEREVANLVTSIIKVKFIRVPSSGAAPWKGDLMVSPDDKQFSNCVIVECKDRRVRIGKIIGQGKFESDISEWLDKDGADVLFFTTYDGALLSAYRVEGKISYIAVTGPKDGAWHILNLMLQRTPGNNGTDQSRRTIPEAVRGNVQ